MSVTAVTPEPWSGIGALTSQLKNRAGWARDLRTADGVSLPAADLLQPDNPQLTALIETFAREHHTDKRIAASQLWKSYCYWLTAPVVAGWVSQRRVLSVGANEVRATVHDSQQPRIRFSLPNPHVYALESDPAANHPAVTTTASPTDLLTTALRRVIDDHLFPAVVAFRERSGLGNRILWGSVAVAFMHPFGSLTTILGRDLRDDIDAVRTALGPTGRLVEMAEVRRQTSAGAVREPRPLRKTCCQKMRIPTKTNCSNCPLLSVERRAEISAAQGVTWLPLQPTISTR